MEQAAPDFTPYIKYIKEHVPAWSNAADEDFNFEKFNSYVNKVFKVSSKKGDPSLQPLIFREHGTITNTRALNIFLEDELEARLFKDAGEHGCGPKCYAGDEKYRIEEFLVGYDRFSLDDVKSPEYRRYHAIACAKFNKMKIDYIEKKNFYDKFIKGDWEFISKIADNTEYLPEHRESILKCNELFTEESMKIVQKLNSESDELVPTHNDQNFANIMINKKEGGKVRLVDYELARMGLPGEDLGAFIFHSCVTFINKADLKLELFPDNYPTPEFFKELASYYIVAFDMKDEDLIKVEDEFAKDKKALDSYIEKNYKKEDFDKRVERIVRNIKIGMLNVTLVMILTFIKGYVPQPWAILFMTIILACRDFYNDKIKEL